MEITQHTTQLNQFRESVYQNLNNRADTLMDLVDAMCSRPKARSVVEYSLAACFPRSYSTIFKAIKEMAVEAMFLPYRLAPYFPKPKIWPFWLLLVDVTPNPRPYARTLADRGMVYQPEVVKGKLPVTIGHQYSTVTLGLEAEAGMTTSWTLPLLTERVATEQDKELVGMAQIGRLLSDQKLPFGRELTVVAEDSSYSKPAALCANRQHPHLVTIARVRSNRTFYHQYVPSAEALAATGQGHPTCYGDRFARSTPTTWTVPDETQTRWETNNKGDEHRIEIQAWHNLVMTGKRKPLPLPMHQHPFTLVRIVRYDKEGKALFKHPLWLIVMGQRRHELTLVHICQAYTARFDIEHFFRFGKQRLRLVGFQTPEVEREENWVQLTHIAYAQLWMGRHVAELLPRPWERNLPAIKQRLISPSLVQRAFARIIRQLGTPARPPKPRGISPGRPNGTKLPKRPRFKVIVKRQLTATAA